MAAAIIMLLAVPAAVAASVLGEQAPGVVIHLALGAACVALALAMFDFGLPRWLNVVGAASAGALGAIFLLQALSLMIPNQAFERIAFAILGQEPERYLPVGILIWFTGLLLAGTQGRTRLIGWAVTPVVVGLVAASFAALLLNIEFPNLRVLFLVPFVWLLIESAKARPTAGGQSMRGARIAPSWPA